MRAVLFRFVLIFSMNKRQDDHWRVGKGWIIGNLEREKVLNREYKYTREIVLNCQAVGCCVHYCPQVVAKFPNSFLVYPAALFLFLTVAFLSF